MDYIFRIQKKYFNQTKKDIIITFLPTLRNVTSNTLHFKDGSEKTFITMIRYPENQEAQWVILEPTVGETDTFVLIREDCLEDDSFVISSNRPELDYLINYNLHIVKATYKFLKSQEYLEEHDSFISEDEHLDMLIEAERDKQKNHGLPSFLNRFRKK